MECAKLYNQCKYRDCEESFSTIDELIRHIEKVHIDFSPEVMEAFEKTKPEFVPMSYILKFTRHDDYPSTSSTIPEPTATPAIEAPEAPKIEMGNNSLLPMPLENEPRKSIFKFTPALLKVPTATSAMEAPEAPKIEMVSNSLFLKPLQNEPQKSILKTYTCPVGWCKKEYKSYSSWRNHCLNHGENDHTLTKAPQLICNRCGKKYKTPSGLQKKHKLTYGHLDKTTPTTTCDDTSSDEGKM